jgi:hypothetical protein
MTSVFFTFIGEDCEQKISHAECTNGGEESEAGHVVAIDHVSLVKVGKPRRSLVEVKSTKVPVPIKIRYFYKIFYSHLEDANY